MKQGTLESASRQISPSSAKETVYVSYMYDIVIRHNEETKLVDTSHHANEDAYSMDILARNGVTSAKDYAHARLYFESKKCTVRHNKRYALVINTRWSSTNHYHWVHENLPRLQILREKFGDF